MYQKYYFNPSEIIEQVVASYDASINIDDSICEVVFDTSDNGRAILADLVLYYPNTLKKYKIITDEICAIMIDKYWGTICLMKEHKKPNPAAKSIRSALINGAYTRGGASEIIAEDIILPRVCSLLGVELEYNNSVATNHSPSLDRIDPTKGYVLGNIEVISFLANRMKNNATPEQLIKFAKNVLRIYGEIA